MHHNFFEFTIDSLWIYFHNGFPFSRIHYVFSIRHANSQCFSWIYHLFSKFIWHVLFLSRIHYWFSLNRFTFSRIRFDFTMHFHNLFIIFFAEFPWIHYLFCEFTMYLLPPLEFTVNPLSVTLIYSKFTMNSP